MGIGALSPLSSPLCGTFVALINLQHLIFTVVLHCLKFISCNHLVNFAVFAYRSLNIALQLLHRKNILVISQSVCTAGDGNVMERLTTGDRMALRFFLE